MEAALLLLLFLLGRKKGTEPKGGAMAVTFTTAWRARVSNLLERSKSGARWVPLLTTLFQKQTAPAVAAARWIGIESGGSPKSTTALDERGLAQGMKDGYTAAEWTELQSPSTSDERHAALAVKEILRATRAMGAGPITPVAIGYGKLYHGLPLMAKELKTQGLIKASIVDTTIAALNAYKPSAKVASYVKGKHAVTGDAVKDLVLRFLAPAAVVAYGDAALSIVVE